ALMESVWAAGGTISAYDPESMGETRRIYGERDDLVLARNAEEAAQGADALVICTEWKQFRIADFEWLRKNLRNPVIIDGRNLYDPERVRQHGLLYLAVGRGDSLRVGASQQR